MKCASILFLFSTTYLGPYRISIYLSVAYEVNEKIENGNIANSRSSVTYHIMTEKEGAKRYNCSNNKLTLHLSLSYLLTNLYFCTLATHLSHLIFAVLKILQNITNLSIPRLEKEMVVSHIIVILFIAQIQESNCIQVLH